jgi:hypothetical protein
MWCGCEALLCGLSGWRRCERMAVRVSADGAGVSLIASWQALVRAL